jgi:hypothetical protein
MFEISLKTEGSTFNSALYDVIHEVFLEVLDEKKQENDLPYMLNKTQLAKHIFNVSPQTLDVHIIPLKNFPKFKVGERILFPRDMVLDWVRNNTKFKNELIREET